MAELVWRTMESAPVKDGSMCLLWARKCGDLNGQYNVYYAEYCSTDASGAIGYYEKDGSVGKDVSKWERMTGWMTVEGEPDYYEDSGAFLEMTPLIPLRWMPLPEGPGT